MTIIEKPVLIIPSSKDPFKKMRKAMLKLKAIRFFRTVHTHIINNNYLCVQNMRSSILTSSSIYDTHASHPDFIEGRFQPLLTKDYYTHDADTRDNTWFEMTEQFFALAERAGPEEMINLQKMILDDPYRFTRARTDPGRLCNVFNNIMRPHYI